ncbi:two-component regulator propeller domain-containing protein [Dyadobacter sp. 676]|uniref:Two-component regulator propeller domain-containing protein n=1 Tax=Dyadobacter sp. 676 TaxID=3088362 RepID=A0AAU8FJX9_9BACT
MRLLMLILLTTLLLAPEPLFAKQEGPGYSLRHFTNENGLPQNSVRSFAADRDGFIWLATDMGLARFDGQYFVTFDAGNLRTSTSQIVSFAPDPEGRKDRLYALSADCNHIKISRGTAVVDSNLLEAYSNGQFKPREANCDWFYWVGLPDRHKGQWPISHYLFLIPGSGGSFLHVAQRREN